jgi:hypothetical protein
MRLHALREDTANVLRDLTRLAHIDSCAFESICSIRQGETTETAAGFVLLKGSQEDPALTLLASTTSTSETVDV